MNGVLDAIRSVPPLAAYGIIALLVFGEAAVFVGFVLPGETAVLLGGFLASQSNLAIVPLILVVVLCAIIGDSVGFEVGKHFGPRVLQLRSSGPTSTASAAPRTPCDVAAVRPSSSAAGRRSSVPSCPASPD